MSSYLATKLREFDVLIEKEEKKIRDCQEQLAAMSHAAANFYESRDQIKELIGRVKVKSDDNYKLRAQIASRLRSLIDRVDVAVAGQAPANSKLTEFLDGIRNDASTKRSATRGPRRGVSTASRGQLMTSSIYASSWSGSRMAKLKWFGQAPKIRFSLSSELRRSSK